MCLTVPGKIKSVNRGKAKVDFAGKERLVDISLVKVKSGDYVLEQNGFAVRKINKKEAKSILQLLNF